ncbi:hypothetical protein PTSG_09308 [Salpingoeca rosetta]|uniref:SH2 domain-containing protein n=1 Tax=Salpingoeca rosetta (strain ATCC 50818 / BSB-021) TaxID=946362 RepID=F2UM93_SALR5|nr:uncharacterized protein PTSG_09308 [Salpingoeca rosetta]EGD78242.1 hypothetical protein PTSG_09308 [Salpingoeca rosetta]|eukprot:XP_004989565.1 hypothetical protein PTSG_09308 [Salpingoeca rosetta]
MASHKRFSFQGPAVTLGAAAATSRLHPAAAATQPQQRQFSRPQHQLAQTDGEFELRPHSDGRWFALNISYGSGTITRIIEKSPEGFMVLGSQSKRAFPTLAALIEHYMVPSVDLPCPLRRRARKSTHPQASAVTSTLASHLAHSPQRSARRVVQH